MSCAKQEALRRYHESFPARTCNVMREAARQIEELRALPPPRPAPRRLRLGEYEHPETGEAMLDGMQHPGL
jgi:hypothetical protein